MSSNLVNRAASITPPYRGKNIWVIASATSSATVAFPDTWYQNYLTLQADGVDFWVQISDSSSHTVVETETTAIASNAFSETPTTECVKIVNGDSMDFDLTQIPWPAIGARQLYLVFKASATGGYLRITRTSGPISL